MAIWLDGAELLSGYVAIRLYGYTAIRLYGYTVALPKECDGENCSKVLKGKTAPKCQKEITAPKC